VKDFSTSNFDYLIVGGGVIGLSLGIAILESNPKNKVCIYEKEKEVSTHASGRNSGVIHAGFYYTPESLKAKFCRDGNIFLRKFCTENDIPILQSGKVVVCRDDLDVQRLEKLYQNGVANGVNIELLDQTALSKIEPAAKTHEKFIWSPNTAVTSPKLVAEKLLEIFEKMGGQIKYSQEVSFTEKNGEIKVRTDQNEFSARKVINCAGAMAADLAHQIEVGQKYLCIPFLGSYKISKKTNRNPEKLIYPVPNPVNPFLGVHTTNTLDGYVKLGPNALPVIGKEQYRLFSKFSFSDIKEFILAGLSLRKGQNLQLIKLGISESKKIKNKNALKEMSKISTGFESNKSWRRYPAGIRAQIVNKETGKLEMDYIINQKLNSIHILNAVSPGWTSSYPFSRWLVETYKLF
jgi:L-2-hydroxyglutarate oxidase LhgO